MTEVGRRARLLEALGIDHWVPRRTVPSEGAAAAVPASAEVPAPAAVPAAAALSAEGVVEAPTGELDWPTLRARVRACRQCALHRGRTQSVFGSGDRAAEWMVVGEAPGADEDRQGEPFVGAAGQLLNAMLAAIELPRDTVFVANVLKCRPPDNRDPLPAEIEQCLPYLHRQVALLRPKIILAVGRVAAQNLLRSEAPLGKLRGTVHRLDGLNTPVVVTYHPAYLLRSPAEKRKAWEDLKFARRLYAELASG